MGWLFKTQFDCDLELIKSKLYVMQYEEGFPCFWSEEKAAIRYSLKNNGLEKTLLLIEQWKVKYIRNYIKIGIDRDIKRIEKRIKELEFDCISSNSPDQKWFERKGIKDPMSPYWLRREKVSLAEVLKFESTIPSMTDNELLVWYKNHQ